jgi:GAF domain-containing protein
MIPGLRPATGEQPGTVDLAMAVTRREFQRRLVRIAMECTGAVCGSFFACAPGESLHCTVVEGLFPPPRFPTDAERARWVTRADRIEWVLRGHALALGEGVIGGVAKSGVGELVSRAEAEVRLVRQDDPALALTSLIAEPLKSAGQVIGVMAVANPADGGSFAAEDASAVRGLMVRAAEHWAEAFAAGRLGE